MTKESQIGFRLSEDLKAVVERAAADENRSVSNWIESLVRRELKSKGLI